VTWPATLGQVRSRHHSVEQSGKEVWIAAAALGIMIEVPAGAIL